MLSSQPRELQAGSFGLELTEEDIFEFLRRLLEMVAGNDYCFMPVERKGTATLRMLIEDLGFPLDWTKVLSSAALGMLPRDFFQGKQIIVFNEMVYHGHKTQETVQAIVEKGGDPALITTAALVTHEACPPADRPKRSLYREVSDQDYRAVRSQLVRMLQRHGSLLLDTEHVEVIVDIDCSLREFYGAIGLSGKAIQFRSGAGRHNLTVYEPDLSLNETAEWIHPRRSNTSGVVEKGRIIQRKPRSFAVYGLYYPDVDFPVDDDWVATLRECAPFAASGIDTGEAAFYTAGLLSGLEVLVSMLIPLFSLGDKVRVHAPGIPPSGQVGPLDHLRSLYPRLDLQGLADYVADKQLCARSKSGSLGKHDTELMTLTQNDLDRACDDLEREMYVEVEKLRDQRTVTGCSSARPHGITCQEVFYIASKRCGLAKAVASAALDHLIDEATVVTHVEPWKREDGSEVWVRTFEPDGEIVAAEIRRFIARAGRPVYAWEHRR